LASADKIHPGGVGEITATFKTAHKKNHQRKSITVTTNDPDNPSFQFAMEGTVIVPYDVSPSYLNFQLVKVGTEATAEVTLTNRTQKTIQLGEPVSPSADLKVVIEKTELKPGESMKITGTFHPKNMDRRILSGFINIPITNLKNKDGSQKSVQVRTYGRVEEVTPTGQNTQK